MQADGSSAGPYGASLITLVDDDGDEFPMWRYPGESEKAVMRRAQEFVDGGRWRPNGELAIGLPVKPGA
jgi:hypothetical protein